MDHWETKNGDGEDLALKKRKVLPPIVVFHDEFWSPKKSVPDDERRRFMVLTNQGFPKDMYNRTKGAFMDHVESMLGEARNARAVIDLPKVGVYSESGKNAQDRFFGNQAAGEALKRVRDDFTLMETDEKVLKERNIEDANTIRELQEDKAMISNLPHLDIPAAHIMNLMAKSLHQRYRTMWQMATNTGLIPATNEEYTEHQRDYNIKLIDYGGFKLHKDRYELYTALAHSGSLRDDLALGKSRYFPVWHPGTDTSARQRLYKKMFEELYSMDYETADWIGLRTQYKNWTRDLKQVVAEQQTKPVNELYSLSANEMHIIADRTRQFYTQVKRLLSGNWDRLDAKRLGAWKPTDALQRDYNSFLEEHQPFAP